MLRSTMIVIAATSIIAGCASAEFDREEELERRLEVREGASSKLPQSVPEESTPAILGEVPDPVLNAIKADLADKLGADAAAFNVVTARSVTWNDGSLGCPRPGQAYTQALVPGYLVVLHHEGVEYDYRAAESGFFFLCELPTLPRRGDKL